MSRPAATASRDSDQAWMHRAVELARRGEGLTRPNPPVGAVLVRSGKVVADGYHRRAGGAHAEIHALREAGTKARGATLYLTLEPCSTTGRTPPCTEAILQAGVKRVVVGTKDPNPAHAGRGLRLLRRHGVETTLGILRAACDELIAPFRTWILQGRPYVTLKLAMTLDGRIADVRGDSKWITGPEARRHVQALRRRADAIMVGAGTARTDDPSLLPRPARGRNPWRVIVSSSGQLPRTLKVLSDEAAGRTIVTCRRDAATHSSPFSPACGLGEPRPPAKVSRRRLEGEPCVSRDPAGRVHGSCAEYLTLPKAGDGVSLKSLLRVLGKRGITHVLCEGGGHLAGLLIRAGLVDAYVFFIAPSLLGGPGTRAAVSGVDWRMKNRPHLRITETIRLGADLCVRAEPLPKED